MWGALIGAGASLVSGIIGAEEQENTNEMNLQIARETSQFNAEQAGINREFQERMSSSAYQRAVADMQKAGLNPMLAYSQGPASSPTGGQGQGVPATMLNKATAGMAAAAQVAQTINTQADTKVKETQAKVNEEVALKTKQDTSTSSAQEANYRQQTIESGYRVGQIRVLTDLNDKQIGQVMAQIDQIAAQTGLTRAETDKVREEILNIAKTGKKIDAETARTISDKLTIDAQTVLRKLEVPGATGAADYFKDVGKGHYYYEHGTKGIGRLTTSASQTRRAFGGKP